MSANVLRHGIRMRTRVSKSQHRAHLRVRPLEPRDVPATTFSLDFNTTSSPTAAGFTGVKPELYSSTAHFGWQSLTGIGAVDRATTNPLTRDFQTGTDGTFLADSIPQGTYDVVVGLGDASAVRDLVSVWAQGQLLGANVTTKAGQFLEVRGRVTVGADGMVALHLLDGGGKNPKFALDYVTLTPDDPNATGLWPDTAKPAGSGSLSTQGAELGLRFQSDMAGLVSGIRFYKGTGNTGIHTGSLWAADGTRLATATFTNETTTGWQTVTFSTPVAIQANATYVASFFSPTGRYSVNLDYFAVSGLTSGHLTVLPGPQGGGGVYNRGVGFPTNTNRSSNYWVDVVFAAGSGPWANAGPDQSANEGSSVSFNGSASGGTGALSYDWDFGDGSAHVTGTLTPAHAYADNGTYTVTLTVTDANNQTATDTAVVTVANVAPTATFSNNGPVNTGATVTLSFANPTDPSSADTAAGFTYSFDFNNDGIWDVADSTSSSATTSFATAGTYTVKGQIKDKDGGATTYSTAVTVNGPLTANAGPDQTANEGSSVSFNGTAGGGSGSLSYDWDFGDGSAHTTGTLTPTHAYADNGTYTVTLKVTDGTNTSVTDTAVVTVNNVAPTATFSNNGPVNTGSTVTMSFTNPADPSSADTAAGFTYSYDFNNDGIWDIVDSTSSSATTSFATAGTYTVKGRIKDKDGGFTDYSTAVTVNNPTSGHTYYVSPTGSDSADGSTGTPFKTLQHAADLVVAGDTVVVETGTYTGFNLAANGTAAARITFSANPGVTINVPNQSGANAGNDGINLQYASYVTIEGFNIVGMPRAGIRAVGDTGVIVENNTCDNNGEWGIFTGFSENVVIEHNVASNSHTQHGIYVSNSADNPVIRWNTVFGNYGCGIHMNGDVSQGGDGMISNALVEGNIIHDNGAGGGAAINADGVNNSVFRNNLLYNNHATGIALFRIDGAAGSTNNVVANNTIVMASNARWALGIANASTGNTVFNNILYNLNTAHGSINISTDSLAGFKSDYNLVFDRFTTNDGRTIMTLAQWQAQTGQDTHSVVSTPAATFVAPTMNDYHLLAGGPAVNTGVSTFNGVSAPPVDLNGNPRPSGGQVDIGCYEFTG